MSIHGSLRRHGNASSQGRHYITIARSTWRRISTCTRVNIVLIHIVAEIVRELNMEIGFCPILRNLKREKDYGVIDNDSITFRELGAEDRNEVFVYLGRILESVLTCQLAKCDSFDVKKDRSSSGDVTMRLLSCRSLLCRQN